ncbi:MAG: glycosyltransferase [Armatimonadota bacterium]
MRVGLFTESYPPVINGVSTSVATLADQLRQRGHVPVVVAPNKPGHIDDHPVTRLPSWTWPLYPGFPFAWPPVGPFARATDRLDLDIVHSHHPFGIGLHARRAARRRGIPHVSTFHTLYHDYTHYFPFVTKRVARDWLTGWLHGFYVECDRIIVPSAHTGKRLLEVGLDAQRIVVVPTGVPGASPVEAAEVARFRAQWHLPEDRPVVLYVGRIAWEKNLRLLIDAFGRLPGDSTLVMVGGGPDFNAIQRSVEDAGLGERIRFTGPIPRSSLGPVFHSATCFAFPSGTETQGLVLAEAQSHGLPCVAVDEGGAPEFVRNDIDALVVPSRLDPFVEAIARLCADSELRERFRIAGLTSPLRITPEQMVDRILDVYRGALGAEPEGA